MLKRAKTALFCLSLACGILIGALSGHAQNAPDPDIGILDQQCQQNAVNQCTGQCADVGACQFGCEIGGINNEDTCSSSCNGLGPVCLNACLGTVHALRICQTPTVGGVVSGLGAGKSVVLQNNGGDNLTVGADGAFTFANYVIIHTAYAVTVSTQPAGQTCSVVRGSGVAGGPVTNVIVSCANDVPTLPKWGNVLLIGLLAGCGMFLLRRTHSRASSPEG